MKLRPFFFAALLGAPALVGRAAETPDIATVYRERAEKIAVPLGLSEAAKTARVRDLIAAQYAALNTLLDGAKAETKALAAKKADEAAIKAVKETADGKVKELHAAYLQKLAAELTPAQIVQVKDGMTYGVVPLTYRVYMEMLPNLTEEQKKQLMAWLVEARELAMDGGTSQEKHAVFGKYKGKINNYLAAAGYNMKQAEKDMFARQKASSAKK